MLMLGSMSTLFDPYRNDVSRLRASNSLTHRLYTMQEAINKYCGFCKQLQNRVPYGGKITKLVSVLLLSVLVIQLVWNFAEYAIYVCHFTGYATCSSCLF